MTGRRTSRGKSRRTYYWDGLQWPSTAVPSGQVVLFLVDPTAQEFMPATLVRIRGHASFAHHGSLADSAASRLVAKIMYVELDDAGTMTGDHAGIDTHEEDIAIRQLWTYSTILGGNNAAAGAEFRGPEITIEIDVKVKIRFEPSGKKALVMLIDSDATNHWNTAGYLRCLLLHG